MVGRRDRDRIDVARRELVETRRPGTPESLCERARAAFVAVADEQDGAAGIGREREGVVGTPQARADDADLDSLVSHASGRSLVLLLPHQFHVKTRVVTDRQLEAIPMVGARHWLSHLVLVTRLVGP